MIVLPVLKKYYTKLCHCLPQDYVKTVDKLKEMLLGLPADYVDKLREYPSTKIINEVLLGSVMCPLSKDDDVFDLCDIMENLCDEITSINVINNLRNSMQLLLLYKK